MNDKKVPLRMCIVCKTSKPKKELVRLVKTDDGIVLDLTGKMNGRGSYICDDINCFNEMNKKKALNKCFKQNISQETYIKLMESYIENKQN